MSTESLKAPDRPLHLAGLLMFLASSTVLMGIITSEVFYPAGYRTGVDEISDLGATRPPGSVSFFPSSQIFNVSFLIAGALLICANVLAHRKTRKWIFTVPFGLFSLGLVGVGLFPGNVTPYHGISSLLTFICGGLAALASCSLIASPFRYAAAAYGLVELGCFFGANRLIPYIGAGGTERWVAYPLVLWLCGFGGYLMASKSEKAPVSPRLEH